MNAENLPKGVEKLSPQQLALLVARLAKKKPSVPGAGRIARRRDDAPPPLSFAQHRFWLLDQLDPGNTAYNMPLAVRLSGKLEPGVLDRVLGEIVRRHEVLRTTFELAGDEPVQRIAPAGPIAIPRVDLSGLGVAEARAESSRLVAEDAKRPFDLAKGPLLRALLLRLGEGEHVLGLDLHHIVSDGWSLGLLANEISALYGAFSAGRPSPLPELAVQYADYAVWQRAWLSGPVLEEHLAYWRERLAGAPPSLELPTDRVRPAVQSHRGAVVWHRLPSRLTEALRELARGLDASLFMVLLAAWKLQMARWSGQDEVVVGAPSAGRQSVETESLVGLFLNNLVLRTDLSGEPTFAGLVARVKDVVLGAYRYQEVPFEQLIDALQPERDLSRAPFFQVLFNMVSLPPASLEMTGLALERMETGDPGAKLDLTVYVYEGEDGLSLQTVYNADLFDRARMKEMTRQLERLLEQAVASPEAETGAFSLVTAAAASVLPDPSAQLPDAWRGTVAEALARHAAAEPERTALVAGGESWSYGALRELAGRVAGSLAEQGVGRGDVVALWAHRNPSLVWNALGVLEAGAAMMILDPAYPAARLLDYLEIGKPKAWLAVAGAPEPPEEVRSVLPQPARPSPLAPLPGRERGKQASSKGLPPLRAGWEGAVGPDDPACLTFTSGSTGKPKGVVGRHGPLTHFYPFMAERFGLSAADRFGMLSALSHDPLQRDLFTPLWLGAALCVPDPERMGDPGYLAEWVQEHGVTVLHLTPAMLDLLVAAAEIAGPLPSLRRAFVVGDLLKQADVELLYGVAPHATCYNLYGSTETQRSVAFFEVPRGVRTGRAVLPLGRGMVGTQLLVHNRAGGLAGVSELGEIHLRGPHLAAGYLGDEALTAERFLDDPHGGGRIYKTGDLGRYLPDGNAEIVGRADFQVKIRGFRIELGEVEAALGRLAGVERCVAVVREDGAGGKRLVAYLAGREIAAPRVLRAELLARLPDYLVPAAFVVLPSLPMTATGKVDRRALPAPVEEEASLGRELSPTEELIAGLWSELLGGERIGAEESFFELGGHSLLATRMVSRVRDVLEVEVPLRTLFEEPTLAGFARRVEALRGAGKSAPAPPLTPRPRGPRVPLSLAQQRLWVVHLLTPRSSAYNMPLAVRFRGPLELAALGRAVREVVRRHESLRTAIALDGEEPVQEVRPAAGWPLATVDLSGLEAAREDESARLAAAEMERPFDLAAGPLFRVVLLRLAPDEHRLILNVHHVVSDGWSLGILLRELAALYRAFAAGEPSPLPQLPVQYADFSLWQRDWLAGGALDAQLAYWRGQLADLPALELPADRPRPRVPTLRGGLVRTELSPDLLGALERLSRERNATLFMTLTAALAALFGRLSGQEDFAVGAPVAGRTRSETEGLIGFFVNTLVLRVDLTDDPPFPRLLARARETALAAYAHQDVTFERVVEELAPARDLSRPPLFQAAFALQNLDARPVSFGPDVEAEGEPRREIGAKTDLALYMARGASGQMGCAAEYARDLFDRATVGRWLGHLESLLAGLAACPETRLSELALLRQAELAQLLDGWNETAVPYPRDAALHRLVAEHAARNPHRPAVLASEGSLTYAELVERAATLARRLAGRGVGPGSRAVLLLERSVESVVASLAVLMTGGAYVPLDPGDPPDRLRFLLADADPAAVVVRRALPAGLENVTVPTVALEAEDGPEAALPGWSDGGMAAYVIYTSGSTGRPKGVVVPHRAVSRLVLGAGYLEAGPDDRFSHTVNPAFDGSVLEVWGALLTGASLVVVPRETVLAPARLAEELDRFGVTKMLVVTALFHHLVREAPGCFAGREVFFGGEAVDPAAVRACLALPRPPRRLVNLYGPTEGGVASTSHAIDPGAPPSPVPIGMPIANTVAYVLDRWDAPSPVGVPGELAIGGDGLAVCYHGRPDLTAERFVPAPWGPPGSRLYRTGDLVRRGVTGAIEFLGRIDTQVKLRGFRIEVGEIEDALRRAPGVAAAAVVLREDEPGERRLVGYVVPQGEAPFDLAALRAGLLRELPGHMVPEALVVLAALPLNRNHKVDRQALPEPERVHRAAATPPRTDLERRVAAVWAEVLRVEQVGVEDSFWELGGHSLLATRVLARLRSALGVELPLQALFEHPTLEGLAAALAEAVVAEGPAGIPLRDRGLPAPLSLAQHRLWLLDRLEPGTTAYNMPLLARLVGPLDHGALEGALTEIVRRHEALRTTFAVLDEEPVQRIAPAARFPLPLVDLAGLEVPAAQAESERLAADAKRPFDLEHGPLVRAVLVCLEARRHLLALDVHHIVSDGWSLGLLSNELSALYAAFSAGAPSPLPEPPIQYADFAAWQRGQTVGAVLAEQLEYWRGRLAGAPPGLDLPTDRLRPAVQSHDGALALALVPKDLADALGELARRLGASLFMVLLAAWKLLAARLSGQEDVVVGAPTAGRRRVETEGLIGLFLNSLVLRTGLSGAPSFAGLVARVKEAVLGADRHQDAPFEMLVSALGVERDLSRTPFFQVLFNMVTLPPAALEMAGLTVERLSGSAPEAKLDLTLYLLEGGDGISIQAVYAVGLFDRARVEEMLRQYELVLRQAVACPEAPIGTFSLVTPDAAALLPDRTASMPDAWHGAVHQGLTRSAARDPHRLALVGEGEEWTYGELEARSNELAHALRAMGVSCGDVVALWAHRSPALVWAVTGVLKAGATMMILDPAYPAARLVDYIEIGQPKAWLAVPGAPEPPEEVRKALPSHQQGSPSSPSLGEEGRGGEGRVGGGRTRAGEVRAEWAACLTFTSGSTGKPKAVVGLHGSLSHFLPFLAERFSLSSADRFGMLSALAHDPLQRDVFTPLWLGAALCVPDPERIASPGYLARWVRSERVTVLNLTPAMLEVLLLAAEENGEEMPSLSRVFVVGDALKRSDVARLRKWAPGLVCTNLYGATETQRALAFFDVPPSGLEREVVPLGRGMEGTDLLVLTQSGELAGVGELGEIHLRGPHLARGYLDDPALTAERFLPDHAGSRLYKTGDLGRYLPDGNAEIVGRADHQVKLRGFRIELGEVEAALLAHPGIRECVAVVREDRPGERRLVAYAVGERVPDVAELRDLLTARLPDSMVPSVVVELPALPVTPAGKVDRLALPAPAFDDAGYVAPRTEIEAVLAAAWAEVLRIERVGVCDNFFGLGGDSILAIKLVSRLRQQGYHLPPREVFLHQTVAAQAAVLRPGATTAGGTPALPGDALAEVGLGRDELDAVLAEL